MAKRTIGIDVDRDHLRIAVLSGEKGQLQLTATGRVARTPETDPAAALRQVLGGDPALGDQIFSALPAEEGYVRRLDFPFADPKKVESTLAFELSAQLPVPVEECLLDSLPPRPAGTGHRVTAAAVPTETVRQFLAPFDQSGVPLQVLDLAPFAFASGFGGKGPALILCLREQETTLALWRDETVAHHRVLPGLLERAEEVRLGVLAREAAALSRLAGEEAPRVFCLGAGASDALVSGLRERGLPVERPRLPFGDTDGEFLPAAVLAWRGAERRERGFNFRKGAFALKSEWAALKQAAVVAVLLLVGILAAGGSAAYLNYAQKAERAEALKREMEQVFLQTFPGTKAIVDVPLQMRSQLNQLQERGRRLGAGNQASPLQVLQTISRHTPENLVVDIRDLSYTTESVRLEGTTASFDAINQLAQSLESSPRVSEVQIADAKMSLDGSRVDFRLTLMLISTTEE